MAVKSPAARGSSAIPARAPKEKSVRPGSADFYRGDTYQISDSVGYLLKQVRWALERAVDGEMDEHDLTGVQWGPLLMLHFKMGTTAADLSRIACVDTGAMTRMLDRLEAKGLLRRTPCAKDRRRVFCRITTKGLDLLEELDDPVNRWDAQAVSVLPPSELDSLITLLDRVRASNY